MKLHGIPRIFPFFCANTSQRVAFFFQGQLFFSLKLILQRGILLIIKQKRFFKNIRPNWFFWPGVKISFFIFKNLKFLFLVFLIIIFVFLIVSTNSNLSMTFKIFWCILIFFTQFKKIQIVQKIIKWPKILYMPMKGYCFC